MSNYHLEVRIIGRGRGRSVTRAMSYMRGEKLYDSYNGKMCYYSRDDVLWKQVFLPQGAPPEYGDPQTLCTKIDEVENRSDARTAREFIGSLPNELPLEELKRIVYEFVTQNFLEHGLCAAVAIHEGKNPTHPERDNPHVHILISTRTLGPEGFSNKKYRPHNGKKYLERWREHWAEIQNRAYERNGLDIRVSHESLAIQGKKREPTVYKNRIEWQKKQRSEYKKDIELARDMELEHELELELETELELEKQKAL